MSFFSDIQSISQIAGLVSPGVIILFIRSRFKNARPFELGQQLFSFSIVSFVYFAFAGPLFHVENGIVLPPSLWAIALHILLPICLAMALVAFDQSEFFYRASGKLGLHPVHHIPTGWEFAFQEREPEFVIVHLNDGTKIYGAWAEGSVASTDENERDVYLSQMLKVEPNGKWGRFNPPRSILICGGTIRLIEFMGKAQHDRKAA